MLANTNYRKRRCRCETFELTPSGVPQLATEFIHLVFHPEELLFGFQAPGRLSSTCTKQTSYINYTKMKRQHKQRERFYV